MSEHQDILPPNATPLMRALAAAGDPLALLDDSVKSINTARQTPPPQFLPFIVWQLGLGKLSPFVPNLYDLIAEGVVWSRILGTIAAVRQGLAFLGYDGTVHNAPVRRRRWNRFAVELDRARDADTPDLFRLEGVVDLSKPLRSRFKRGFKGYDVRAAELSWSQFSRSRYSSDSGVRVGAGSAKWSFGRSYELETQVTEAAQIATGIWVPPAPTGSLWVNDDSLWIDQDVLWFLAPLAARNKQLAEALAPITRYVRFSGSGGVIGYSRAIARPVAQSSSGEYRFGLNRYRANPASPDAVYVSARTDFGDGAGEVATSAAVMANVTLAPGIQPGKRWLMPGDVTSETVMTSAAVSIPFGLSVREHVKFLLRFL